MLGLKSLVREALQEDIGQGDVTTNATVPENSRCRARVLAKQAGVVSGIRVFRTVFEELEAELSDWTSLEDGTHFERGVEVASFAGKTRAVLTGERVALNFLQHLSGIATLTAAYVKCANGLDLRICETRKTTPLLRQLEKLAVVHGGGVNHRFALFDGVLIKENHITAAGGIAKAVKGAVDATHHLMRIGIEVKNLEELEEAINAGADSILLDNMSIDEMKLAVERTRGTRVVLEASGGITLERVRAIAETGVHVVSIGSLTHSAPAIDLSMLIQNA